MDISEKVELFLKKYNLLNDDKTIITAFSGGYDSMCLLDILIKLSKKYNFKPAAIHLNHNWRGDESKQEELNCKNFAQKFNVDFYCETLADDIPCNETSAREARYVFFEKCAEKFNTDCILTAHNADDNAETLIYRIIKGTGTNGLEGIKEHRDIFYRPLLSVYRDEIEQYCRENSLLPNNDSSNNDTKYKRNLIRHKLFPIFEAINPNYKQAINSLSEIAAMDNDIIEQSENLNINDTKKFLSLEKPFQNRVIYNILKSNNIDYDREKIEKIKNFIYENKNSKSGKTYSLSSTLWLFTNDKIIKVISNSEKSDVEIQINKEGTFNSEDFTFEVLPFNQEENVKFPSENADFAYADLSGYNIDFTLRTRRDGDIIQPFGMKGTQKLKKYFNEKKIPNHKKDNIWLLCCKKEVLWAIGTGISEKIRVIGKPTHIIKFSDKIKNTT